MTVQFARASEKPYNSELQAEVDLGKRLLCLQECYAYDNLTY
jgi:hypothetical protein